jgi:hypothetical protein
LIFDEEINKFKLLALSHLIFNKKEIDKKDGLIVLENLDSILFECDPSKPCLIPHYYHVVYPNESETEAYKKTSFHPFEKRDRNA